MSETTKTSILAIEQQLSHVNARLSDTMELLKQSATSIKFACAIISGLQTAVEDIYLSLDGNDVDEIGTENNEDKAEHIVKEELSNEEIV